MDATGPWCGPLRPHFLQARPAKTCRSGGRPGALLLSRHLLRREGEQYVARNPVLESDVSGTDEDHAVGDGRPARSDGASFRRDTVHGFEFLRGVEFPDGTSIGGGNGSQYAVHASGEK